MIVRTASRGDLLGIGRVAEAAHWASYHELLPPETIGQLVGRDFAPSVLRRRLLRGGLVVATHEGEVVGFGDCVHFPDRLQVTALFADPGFRRHGVGTALLTSVRDQAGQLPAAADLLLGQVEVEQFFEANGFVPGEVSEGLLFGVQVVERRWWSEAAADEGRDRAVGG